MSARGAALLGGAGGALVTAAIAALLALAGVFDTGNDARPASTARTATTEARKPSDAATPKPAPATPLDLAARVYRQVSAGVVEIRTSDGEGTGFVVDTRGRIVTNAHVVEGFKRVRVQFGRDAPSIPGRVVGRDRASDLAVVRVLPRRVRGGLKPLALADSGAVHVGDPVVAIGNPFGLTGTVTSGIVSALGREIDAPDGFSIPGAIQTDAAINPGNSGGPLLDRDARVIGVNSQIETGDSGRGNVGVGFAVPSNIVRSVAASLRTGRPVRHAWLGVATGVPQTGGGALVRTVVRGGPAARAGLRAGDVIERIGTAPVGGSDDVSAVVFAARPGETVAVEYRRHGRTRTARVHLARRPSQPPTGSLG